MNKVVVVYSGGLDSTVLLKKMLLDVGEVVALNFDYGSKHNDAEREAAKKICNKLHVKLVGIDLPFVGKMFKSDLLKSGGPIPEGHYEAESMKSTVVPFRNGIMLSIAIGYAESIGADTVCIANHAGDHAIYKDCTTKFIKMMDLASKSGTNTEIGVFSPFKYFSKADIVKIGLNIGAPMELSWSCYKGGIVHCGKCGTCQERRGAFELAGVKDQTKYAPDYTEIRDVRIRTKICNLMSEMLDNPDVNGIFPTSKFMWEMETFILEENEGGTVR